MMPENEDLALATGKEHRLVGEIADVWLPVTGYDNLYEVSASGRVRSLDRNVVHLSHGEVKGTRRYPGKVLKPTPNRTGHLYVFLSKNGGRRRRSVHQLVALAFHGEPPGPIGAKGGEWVVDHIDGDPTNNGATNLRWMESNAHRASGAVRGQSPAGERNGSAKVTNSQVDEIRQRVRNGEYYRDVADEYGISHSYCNRLIHGRARRS